MPNIQPFARCPECVDHPLIGQQGEHFHVCKFGPERHEKHKQFNNTFIQFVQAAGLNVKNEPNNCFPLSSTALRPDAQIFGVFDDPKKVLLTDVSATHPCTQSNFNATFPSSEVHRAAASTREQEKNTKYVAESTRHDAVFLPIVFETYGSLGKRAISFFDHIADKIAGRWKHIPPSVVKDFWFKKLSFEIQRGVACMHIDRTRTVLLSDYHNNPYLEEERQNDLTNRHLINESSVMNFIMDDGSNLWSHE